MKTEPRTQSRFHERSGALLVLLLAVLFAAASGPAMLMARPLPSAGGEGARDSLVTVERAFAAMSLASGMRDAFLTYLAPDGIIFRPLPVNGREVWASRDPSTARLSWEPDYAEVSAAGDLGYTSGPWELRPPAEEPDQTPAYGHFISVWKKQAAGAWRLEVDLGVSHPRPEHGVGSAKLEAGSAHDASWTAVPPAGSRPDLTALDGRLTRVSRDAGVLAAYDSLSASDLRLNEDGSFPAVGLEEARRLLRREKGWLRFSTSGSGSASSGDLGYTYGVVERFGDGSPGSPKGPSTAASPPLPDSSIYLNVWRKAPDQDWKLALAVIRRIQRG